MFKKIKSFFSKKKQITEKPYTTANIVSFQDMQLRPVIIEIKTNGNSTLLDIRNNNENLVFTFDNEQCLLLVAILQEYVRKGNLSEIANLLKGDE